MRLVHISDIHFGEDEIDRPDDPNLALRHDLIADVATMCGRLGFARAILISGDIANKGRSAEYDFALDWLERHLSPAAGCTLEEVFCIPGNHDVDRGVGNRKFDRLIREDLRRTSPHQVDGKIREYLSDPETAPRLHEPIENYNRFAARFHCNLKPHAKQSDALVGQNPPLIN
jgi:3',5'-cyclic AMP phosphodiesterase CpdA